MNETAGKPSDQAASILLAELLYDAAPHMDFDQINNRLASAMPSAKLVSKRENSNTFLIEHSDHLFELKDGKKVPLLTAMVASDLGDRTRLTPALHQTWDWPDAKRVVERATHQVLITEMMAQAFDHQIRVNIFYDVLVHMSELAPPLCIHCHHAQRILDPQRLIKASGSANADEKLAAFLNVRLFRIENQGPGDVVMDTMGLAAVRLPDLQIHFRNLDPKAIASMLYNAALYIYKNGDCIQDGHTIQGLAEDQKWRCQHEEALVAPKRIVIDIDPGDPFAAGRRRR